VNGAGIVIGPISWNSQNATFLENNQKKVVPWDINQSHWALKLGKTRKGRFQNKRRGKYLLSV
tara:strand:+ start:284 stop:472 length:189 start_codon:yes stop_codon:yes gene_type:complete